MDGKVHRFKLWHQKSVQKWISFRYAVTVSHGYYSPNTRVRLEPPGFDYQYVCVGQSMLSKVIRSIIVERGSLSAV